MNIINIIYYCYSNSVDFVKYNLSHISLLNFFYFLTPFILFYVLHTFFEQDTKKLATFRQLN